MIERLRASFKGIEQEAIQDKSVGEAIIVVHRDPSLNGNVDNFKIATVKERKSKLSSRRKEGEKSIIIETKKVGENRLSNIIGGLAEVCDDESLPEFAKGLFFVEEGLSYTFIDGNLVGLSVLVYDGSIDIDLRPICAEEVEFNGWINIGSFLGLPDAREIAKQFVETAKNKNLIEIAVHNYQSSESRLPIFEPGFSMERFYYQREMEPDVKFSLAPQNQH